MKKCIGVSVVCFILIQAFIIYWCCHSVSRETRHFSWLLVKFPPAVKKILKENVLDSQQDSLDVKTDELLHESSSTTSWRDRGSEHTDSWRRLKERQSGIFNLPKLTVKKVAVVSGTEKAAAVSIAADRGTISPSSKSGSKLDNIKNSITVPQVASKKTLKSHNSDSHSADLNTESIQSHTVTATEVPSNTTSTSPPRNWKKGTFCHDFLVNTFKLELPMCQRQVGFLFQERPAARCFGNSYSDSMATCVLENTVVYTRILSRTLSDVDYPEFKTGKYPMGLLEGVGTSCYNVSTLALQKHTERGDYIVKLMDKIREHQFDQNLTDSRDASICESWVNETVLFFSAHRFHIYFRFLDYFNLHKILEDFAHEITDGGVRIVRVSGSDNYHFPEFDQSLFPNITVQTLADFQNARTCFKKIILIPKSYASVLFQCKMKVTLRGKCSPCSGQGLNETQISTFRSRVLKACSLGEAREKTEPPSTQNGMLLVLVSRKQYLRNSNDKAKNFERVMSNENELVMALRKSFNHTDVAIVHLENLEICEQVAYGYNASVYLGVHGSGLVHLWWTHDDALVYELEPHYEITNPSFRMLAKLSGRNYQKEYISGGWAAVKADVGSIIGNLRKHSRLT